MAAQKRHTEIAKLFLDNNADGSKTIEVAKRSGHFDIVNLLQ